MTLNSIKIISALSFLLITIGYFIPIIDFYGKISFLGALKFGLKENFLIFIASLLMILSYVSITIMSLINRNLKRILLFGVLCYNISFIYIMYLILSFYSQDLLLGFWINLIGFMLLNITVLLKLKNIKAPKSFQD